MDNLYNLHEKCFRQARSLTEANNGNFNKSKKLHGALTALVVRQALLQWIEMNHIAAEVSGQNVYIWGSNYEYDLLLIRKGAKAFYGLVYEPSDVLAILECKCSGLFRVDSESGRIAKAVNRAVELNSQIRFGYVTMWERIPVNKVNWYGGATVNHWEQTQEMLGEKIACPCAIYAVTLSPSQKKAVYDENSQKEFEQFASMLLGK